MVGMKTSFIPVNTAKLIKASAGFTVTGERRYEEPVRVGISIVRLATSVSQTSVRADKSGTKSYADEQLEKGRVLMHPRHTPKEGDIIEIFGDRFEITGVRKVFAMNGILDHYQVEL